jgi:hypothetical protein
MKLASVHLLQMINPLNIAIYVVGVFMLFALAIGFLAAPVCDGTGAEIGSNPDELWAGSNRCC